MLRHSKPCEIITAKVTLMSIKTYSELITIPSFIERFRYLKLNGHVGQETFGYDRYLNQTFYTSKIWRDFRRRIIIRDLGCDLGIEGRDIHDLIMIHHIEPIAVEDILRNSELLIDPENAICTSPLTHRAIHYGDESLLLTGPIERRKNDTCPWR